MSEVTLHIGGRKFTVACADGEEERVSRLGHVIDQKVEAMDISLGLNESQNFLFTSLLLADELSDSQAAADEARTSAENATASFTALEAAHTSLQEKSDSLEQQLQDITAERDALKIAASDAKRDGETARAELKTALIAQADSATEMQDLLSQRSALREELDEKTAAAETMQAEIDGHKAKIGALTKERDEALDHVGSAGDAAQTKALENKVTELEATIAQLRDELSAAKSQSAGGSSLTDDPDLAPALENFASLLENCAAKLESAAANA